MSLSLADRKRPSDGGNGDGSRRVSQKVGAGESSAQPSGNHGLQLPPPFKLQGNLSKLKPEGLLDRISGLPRKRYSRDLLSVFSERSLEGELAQMHQRWFEVRKPSSAEMWSHGQHPPSSKKGILQCVNTMLDVRAQVTQAGNPEIARLASKILFDYIMLMYIDANSKAALDQKFADQLHKTGKTGPPDHQAQGYLEDIRADEIGFERLFQSLAETLAGDTLSGAATEPIARAIDPSIKDDTRAVINLLRVDRDQGKGFERVAGYKDVKASLKSALIGPIKCPHITQRAGAPPGVLLYGPPGTGKTNLARSVAMEFPQCTVYQASSGDLFDKWVGSSERNVKALFAVANENSPAAIVLDEVDALCRTRQSGNQAESTLRFSTQLLEAMTSYADVVVIGMTNLPWMLDSAFLRRFNERVHVGLPDAVTRYEMFKLMVNDYLNNLGESDGRELARLTEGFTGSLIRDSIDKICRYLVVEADEATHFRSISFKGKTCYCVCSPSHQDCQVRTFDSVADIFEPGPLTLKMLKSMVEREKAFKVTNERDVQMCIKWSREVFHSQ